MKCSASSSAVLSMEMQFTVHSCKMSIDRPTNISIAGIWLRVPTSHSHCLVMVRDPKFYKLICVNYLIFF